VTGVGPPPITPEGGSVGVPSIASVAILRRRCSRCDGTGSRSGRCPEGLGPGRSPRWNGRLSKPSSIADRLLGEPGVFGSRRTANTREPASMAAVEPTVWCRSMAFPVRSVRHPCEQAHRVSAGPHGPPATPSRRRGRSVSSRSGFLVAGFHPRRRSAFAVSHDLDGLTFLVLSGVFQPVTLMGFGALSEYPGRSRSVLGPKPSVRTTPGDASVHARTANRRSGPSSGTSRQAGARRHRRRRGTPPGARP